MDRFLIDFGLQNGAKIEEKSMKKMIKFINRFYRFWGRFGSDFGGQDGSQIDEKRGPKTISKNREKIRAAGRRE